MEIHVTLKKKPRKDSDLVFYNVCETRAINRRRLSTVHVFTYKLIIVLVRLQLNQTQKAHKTGQTESGTNHEQKYMLKKEK